MDLREPIYNCHSVNFFVVLRFRVRAAEKLQYGGTHLDTVAVVQNLLANDELFVEIRPIG